MWNGLCVFCQHVHWVFRYTSWGLSSGITTFPFADNLVSNHQVPILPTHSKKVTLTRFSVMAYTSDNYKTRGTHSGNTDQAPLCSRCSTMAHGSKGSSIFKVLRIQWTHVQTRKVSFRLKVMWSEHVFIKPRKAWVWV